MLPIVTVFGEIFVNLGEFTEIRPACSTTCKSSIRSYFEGLRVPLVSSIGFTRPKGIGGGCGFFFVVITLVSMPGVMVRLAVLVILRVSCPFSRMVKIDTGQEFECTLFFLDHPGPGPGRF